MIRRSDQIDTIIFALILELLSTREDTDVVSRQLSMIFLASSVDVYFHGHVLHYVLHPVPRLCDAHGIPFVAAFSICSAQHSPQSGGRYQRKNNVHFLNQVRDFAAEVVGKPVFLVCNSVGGIAGLQAGTDAPDQVTLLSHCCCIIPENHGLQRLLPTFTTGDAPEM